MTLVKSPDTASRKANAVPSRPCAGLDARISAVRVRSIRGSWASRRGDQPGDRLAHLSEAERRLIRLGPHLTQHPLQLAGVRDERLEPCSDLLCLRRQPDAQRLTRTFRRPSKSVDTGRRQSHRAEALDRSAHHAGDATRAPERAPAPLLACTASLSSAPMLLAMDLRTALASSRALMMTALSG